MFLKKIVFVSLLFFVFLQPRTGLTADLADIQSWSLLEQETLQLLKRFAPEEALSPSASLEKRIRFYLRAGLWSSAEQLLLSQPQDEGKRLLLLLYLHEQRFDRVYALYQKEPELYRDEPLIRLGAAQGALLQKSYAETITLLGPVPPSNKQAPYYFYLSAQAYAGLHDRAGFDRMIAMATQWGERHPDSPWTARTQLLKGYDQLGRKRYQEAFLSLGEILSENAYSDLALLGIASGYLEMGEPGTFVSLLEGFQQTQGGSLHAERFLEILSRYQEAEGDFQGAIETTRLARTALQREKEALAERREQVLNGERLALTVPPGALLKKTLLNLEAQVGEKKEIGALINQIEFHHRQRVLASLISSERALKKKEEAFRGAMIRRCLAVESRSAVGPGEARNPLYFQARSAAMEGNKEETEALLKKLLANDPAGRDREETTFRLAELAFERKDYAAAATYYDTFSDRPASYLSRMALYKGAWSDFLQGKGMKAIRSLLRQRLLMKGAAAAGSPCESELEPETRAEYFRLLTLALEAEGGADRFIAAGRELSPEEAFPLTLELAQYYDATDRKKEVAQLAAGWVSSYPLYAETPLLHHAWIEALRAGPAALTPQTFSARVAFIERYWPDGPWARENGEERWNEVRPLLKEQLRDLLFHYHIEAKKTEQVAYYREILPWYERYLDLFPAESETGEIRFLYAEVLNGMGEKKQAAEIYQASAYDDLPHRLAAEAGYRAVLLSEKLYTPSDPDLWDGYARFIRTFPSDRRVAQIYLKQAELAFKQGAFDQSRQWAEAAAKNENGTRCSGDLKGCALESTAHKLVVQGYLAQKAYPEAISYLRGLLAARSEAPAKGAGAARPALFDDKEKAEFRKLLVLAYYQQGEALKEKSRLPAAADSYWQAYQEGTSGEMGPLALFEAAAIWGSLNRAKAEEALGLFQQRYPQSPLYHPVLIRLAALYMETDRPREAAQVYEKAGQLRADPAFALQSLGEAIALYETMGNWGKVSLLSLQMAEQAGNDKEKWTEGMVKQAEAKLKLGEEKGAKKILTDLVKNQKPESGPKERNSVPMAKAHLLLADMEIKQFEQIKLVTPLEKNLQKKKALFERLLNDYALAAAAPSPPLVLAATYRMGELFEEFSRSLLESERPADLSLEEKQAYEDLLKEQALPYLKKAVEAYRQNIDWGKKALIENEWIIKSQNRYRLIQEDPTASGEIFDPKG